MAYDYDESTMPPANVPIEDAEVERRRRAEAGMTMPPAPVPSTPGSRNYNLSVGATNHPSMPPAGIPAQPAAPDLSKMPPAGFAPPSPTGAAPARPADTGAALGMPPAGKPADVRSTAFSMPPAPIPGPAEKHEQELREQGRPGSPEGPDLPWWKRVLDTIAQSHPIGRLVERNIPGSPGNFDWELARATAAGEHERGVTKEKSAEQRANAPQHVGQFTSDEGAETEVSRDPQTGGFSTQKVGDIQKKDDVGKTPEEGTLHDLMTGENGQPRINPETKKPYTYLEAYGAVKQAAQNVKPDQLAAPDRATYDALIKQGRTPQQAFQWLEQNRKVGNAGGGVGDAGIKDIAQAIMKGEQPPTLQGLYRQGAAVRAELAKQGFNLARAESDWHATQKHLATLNGAQQERLRQAVSFTSDSLGIIDDLYSQWQKVGSTSGWKAFNKASLETAKQLPGQAGNIANRLEAQINDLTAELGTVYKGGNSSTDESLKLAAQNLKAEWNEQTFKSALGQIRQNLEIRQNSIRHSQPAGVSEGSPYTPKEEKESGGGEAGKKWNAEKGVYE